MPLLQMATAVCSLSDGVQSAMSLQLALARFSGGFEVSDQPILLCCRRRTDRAAMITTAQAEEPVLWQTYVSWNQFAWLYLVSLFTALRGALIWQAAIPGWELWVIGAVALLVVALVLRYWVRYVATAQRVLIKNAFTGREIQVMAIEHISEATIKQGVIAWLLGIGTIAFKSTRGDEVMQFRGVSDPEVTLQHIQAVRRRRVFPES
jgi:Bacterial PH domain